jgi:hypothetical protein
MKKKLMRQQGSQVENFLQKEVQKKSIGHAKKFVVDSVIDDKFRVLTSVSKTPIPKTIKVEELAKFDLWERSESDVIAIKDAFQKIGVRANQIKEANVFVKLEDKTFEITEFVRQEIKNHYLPLVKREFTPYRPKKGESP